MQDSGSVSGGRAHARLPETQPPARTPDKGGELDRSGSDQHLPMATASLGVGGAAAPPDPALFRLNSAGLLALQRAAGNQAVGAAVQSLQRRRMVQRVLVETEGSGETLYNETEETPGGQAGAQHYGGEGRYELERNGDDGATVTVKIKFMRQHRNTLPPPRGRAGAPQVGDLVGEPTELPPGDRPWAEQTSAGAMNHWNGRLLFVSEETIASDLPGAEATTQPKRLPVTFRSQAVFGVNEEAHHTVIVHPARVVGGSRGNPIDAGNYYMEKDNSIYPDSDDAIYAHEYGHLLGINDEYSQSNEQMNLLLHQAAPAGAASSMDALDRETVQRMTLAAIGRRLRVQFDAAMPTVTNALRAQRNLVKSHMAAAAGEGVQADNVREQLTSRLQNSAIGRLDPQIPAAIAFQTTRNFSNRSIASAAVEQAFAVQALSSRIIGAYRQAFQDYLVPVQIEGFGSVAINVQGSIFGASQVPGSAIAAPAAAIAEARIGPAANRRVPEVPPSNTLVGELSAIPGTWSEAGSALETGVNPAAFAAKMAAVLQSAAVAAAEAEAALPPGVRRRRASTTRALNGMAYRLVQNSARTAAQQLVADLLDGQLTPVLRRSVADLQAAIGVEVDRVMTMTPGELASQADHDANIRAVVADMKGRLDTAKAGLAGTGMDPLGVEGATSPAQDVTYSYQGLMGSGRTSAMRADQFAPMVRQFNDNFKGEHERDFTVEVQGGG